MIPRTLSRILCPLFMLVLLPLPWMLSATPARAQERSAAQPAQQNSERKSESDSEAKKDDNQAASEKKTLGGELVEQTRDAEGEGEENVKLKHSNPVRWLARKTNLTVHGAHLLASVVNFALIAVLFFWAGKKFLPAVFSNRTASIQKALEEARAASQDANRRLADIEHRLRQLDVEIGHMQANAEKEADAEEERIQKAAEEDIRKVVLAAEQEIGAAAKQARRELATHTADLAIALARKQIHVDSNTDQVLVRSFASDLGSQNDAAPKRRNNDGGKDGR